jgi:CheY-like chemotaxis protein
MNQGARHMQPPAQRLIDPTVESNEVAEGEPAVRPGRKNPGVLVVDDEQAVRIVTQLGLERTGFDVWAASGGREAIRLYHKHRHDIDFVLLDVCMPGMDGVQTLDALRALNPQVLACFMSGNMGTYEPEVLRQRGAAYVLAKPFHIDKLVGLLRLLGEAKSADPLSRTECLR